MTVDVVVLFSCHCFTHDIAKDGRAYANIPDDERFVTSDETRVLNPERYALSKALLRPLIKGLPTRKIIVAHPQQLNFVTFEKQINATEVAYYGVFFDVERDKNRKRRLIFRVQSAYLLPQLTKRQKEAKKVGLLTLLKAAHEGRKIRP